LYSALPWQVWIGPTIRHAAIKVTLSFGHFPDSAPAIGTRAAIPGSIPSAPIQARCAHEISFI
jgi:hypothetical protein